MRIITVSREFGSGGREIGKRLADYFNCDYYDSEIITMVAEKSGMNADYIENALGNHGWRNHTVSFGCTFTSSVYGQAAKAKLLLQQKKVIEEIASFGKDFVIVGRNADVILESFEPFNIFVCASTEAKLERCMQRATADEGLSEKEMLKKMNRIDRVRKETREILTQSEWGERGAYHLTVNTTGWNIKELVPAVGAFAEAWFGRGK